MSLAVSVQQTDRNTADTHRIRKEGEGDDSLKEITKNLGLNNCRP